MHFTRVVAAVAREAGKEGRRSQLVLIKIIRATAGLRKTQKVGSVMPKARLTCHDAALTLIARRAYSVKELAGALKKKQYADAEIAAVLQDFEHKGWLNDAKFAHTRARNRAEGQGWGRARIQQELMQKGVAETLVQAAVQALEQEADTPFASPAHDFQQTATDLLRRRFGPLPHDLQQPQATETFEEKQTRRKTLEKEKQRRFQFLLRRGYSFEEAKTALDQAEEDNT